MRPTGLNVVHLMILKKWDCGRLDEISFVSSVTEPVPNKAAPPSFQDIIIRLHGSLHELNQGNLGKCVPRIACKVN